MMIAVHEATRATATFLFTDIEGSTQLLKSHRGEYVTILAEHRRLLSEAFTAHGGKEIDN
jgi:class 3 adenylate cyclase